MQAIDVRVDPLRDVLFHFKPLSWGGQLLWRYIICPMLLLAAALPIVAGVSIVGVEMRARELFGKSLVQLSAEQFTRLHAELSRNSILQLNSGAPESALPDMAGTLTLIFLAVFAFIFIGCAYQAIRRLFQMRKFYTNHNYSEPSVWAHVNPSKARIDLFDRSIREIEEAENRYLELARRPVSILGVPLRKRNVYLLAGQLMLYATAFICVASFIHAAALPYFHLGSSQWEIQAAGQLNGLIIFPLFFGSIYLAMRFLSIGRARAQIPSEEVLARDQRRPVVYLRQFRTDDLKVVAKNMGWPARLMSISPFIERRFEEALSAHFWKFGPLIAIGEPSEGLPTLGAARVYYDGDAWKEAIQKWMGEARLIAIMPGDSPGIRWELSHALEGNLHNKLAIVLPPDVATLSTGLARAFPFVGSFARLRPAGERADAIEVLWAAIEDRGLHRGLNKTDFRDAVLVYFRGNGDAVILSSRIKDEAAYIAAIRLMTYDCIVRRELASTA